MNNQVAVKSTFTLLFLLAVNLYSPNGTRADGIEFMTEVKIAKSTNQQRHQMFPPNFVEQQLFGLHQNAEGTRKHLIKKLRGKTELLAKVCELDDSQREKIELAGVGDIHQFMRDCQKVLDKMEPNQQNFNNIWQEIQPLQMKLNTDLHGQYSMFARSLNQCLNSHQAEKLKARSQQAAKISLELSVRRMVNQLDQVAPMEAIRRNRLTEFLIENVPAIDKELTAQQKQMLTMYVLYQVAELQESKPEELKSHFNDDEWKPFSRGMKSGKQYGNQLKQMGMIE